MSKAVNRAAETPRCPVADLLLTTGLAVLFAAALVTSFAWSIKAGLFPRLVTGLGLSLALLHLTLLLWEGRRNRRAAAAPASVPAPPALAVVTHPESAQPEHPQAARAEADDEADYDVEYIFAHAGGRAWAAALGWVAFFFFGLYVLGLFVIAPLFALAYLKHTARASWLFSVTYAVITLLILYGGLEYALKISTPQGLLL